MNINKYLKINLSFVVFLFVSLFSGLIFKSTLFLFCLFFHELGHLIMIIFLKQRIKQFEITGFGMIINAHFEIQPLRKGLIYSGGLIFTFFLQIIFSLFNLKELMNINLSILFINLLPIPPLDGFNILVCIFEIFFDEEYSLDVCLDISIIVVVLLLIIFLLTKIYFILFLITFSVSKIFKYQSTKKIMYLKRYLKLIPHKQISV